MPIIDVEIINENNGKTAIIKAIVDTGADVSLVPASIKTSLGPGLIMKTNKVQDFNGNIFEAPSYFSEGQAW